MSEQPLLPTVEVETASPVTASIVWLHGLGASGHDFEPFVPELRLPRSLGLRFVFPHAPRQPVTINGRYVTRAWYDIVHPDLGRQVDEAGIRQSVQAVAALLDRERQRGTPAERLLLAGFSQGGVIALHAGLRYPAKLAGILALSTYLPFPASLDTEASAANRGTPIFLAHGDYDPVVPLTLAEDARHQLDSRGYPVDWRHYPMAHSVSAAEIGDISGWLQGRIGSG
ncbi:MAG: alpha/beta hydrolase [Pseudomonadota bacterium]